MFLRAKRRFKDGKEHRYWSLVENHRVTGGRVVQRQVLYLAEINDAQRAAWCRSIEVFDADGARSQQMALFADDRPAPELALAVVQVRLSELSLHHPRQFGGCWLALRLWEQLDLDEFWAEKLRPSRKGTRWLNVLKVLVCHRLLAPGSEWRLHRQWFRETALADLLGEDLGVAEKDTLYRCLDRLLDHKEAFFQFLTERWQTLFGARFEVLLYDLTSTYFECVPPEEGQRKFGYSRDKRADCVQVVIALIVTPEGFPLAYEVMPGNTSDRTTLADFLQAIERQYGKANRTWVMDRGIPTEDTLALMRQSDPPVHYLVGTPKGRLTRLERSFLAQPWAEARESVHVKLLEQDGELYVLARSDGRADKERAMRRRRLKRLWQRLHELRRQDLSRDQLLLKLGAAKKEAGRAYGLVDIQMPGATQPVTPDTFQFSLCKAKLRQTRRREGCYLLRSNLTATDPAMLWQYYIQLTEIEQAFKELKSELSLRPIYHQLDHRIEAHIFVAFIAYCLQVTLKFQARRLAPGLTPRAILEKLSAIQMVDVHLPTTDGRHVILPRYTQPDPDQQLLLQRLKLVLPQQPPPRIRSSNPSVTTLTAASL
ncbi:IS1634 family transposase [Methylotetracoccus oryzae]|uniref:IS1634 family transposase n=1 Tax=Methylotetracoccus oryzae TaxID=1919059 RepID=UPI00111A6629|nr:IS1634 family transposase [Methylotetracoccus oryzae]